MRTWDASYLAFVLPLTAEQVLQPARPGDTGATRESRREWAWVRTAQRLTWQYGEAEALARLNWLSSQPARDGLAAAHRAAKALAR